MNTGGRLVKHARYCWLPLAESHLTRRLFGGMMRRIDALPVLAGVGPGGLQTKNLGKEGGGDGQVSLESIGTTAICWLRRPSPGPGRCFLP